MNDSSPFLTRAMYFPGYKSDNLALEFLYFTLKTLALSPIHDRSKEIVHLHAADPHLLPGMIYAVIFEWTFSPLMK